ncbi:MAG: hypothetical protein JNK05_01805 [Myxococcales bacterium]|nr:hypothetical protein [Myxococcales bacterium]
MRTLSRRPLVPLAFVVLSWGAIVATSQPRWSVASSQTIAPFTMNAGETRTFRVTIRPSTAALAFGQSRVATNLTVTSRSTVVGSPRPATVAVSLAPDRTLGVLSNNGTTASHSSPCPEQAGCVRTYLLTVRWPDAAPGASANAVLDVRGEVEGRGESRAPAGASALLEVVPQ